MPIKALVKDIPDSYLALVKRFPLRHIRDGEHLDAAQKMIDRLLEMKLTAQAQEYLDVLTDLVEIYQDRHEPIPDSSEADVLRELMRANGLSQSRLAEKVGISQSTISSVLNGARSLTKEQIVALARLFVVAPAAFLPTSPTLLRKRIGRDRSRSN